MGKKGPALPVCCGVGVLGRGGMYAQAPRPVGTCPAGRMEIKLLIPEMYNSRNCMDHLTFEEFWNFSWIFSLGDCARGFPLASWYLYECLNSVIHIFQIKRELPCPFSSLRATDF